MKRPVIESLASSSEELQGSLTSSDADALGIHEFPIKFFRKHQEGKNYNSMSALGELTSHSIID